MCHKWHYKITKAMVVCLDSGDYVQIRNALIVLIRVLPHFPVLEKLAQIIERKVEKVWTCCSYNAGYGIGLILDSNNFSMSIMYV